MEAYSSPIERLTFCFSSRSSSRVFSSDWRNRLTSDGTSSSRMGTRKTEASRRSMITARPMAMPGETPMPLYVRTSFRVGGVSFVARSASMLCSFYFVEFRIDQLLDRVHGLFLVFTVGSHSDDGAPAGGQQQNAQDALAVDLLVAFADFDVRFVPRRAVNEFCGGACVQAQLVLDLDVARDQPAAPIKFILTRSEAKRKDLRSRSWFAAFEASRGATGDP